MPTKLRKVPRRSFSMAIALDCSNAMGQQHPQFLAA
jgi:hypothetical protein